MRWVRALTTGPLLVSEIREPYEKTGVLDNFCGIENTITLSTWWCEASDDQHLHRVQVVDCWVQVERWSNHSVTVLLGHWASTWLAWVDYKARAQNGKVQSESSGSRSFAIWKERECMVFCIEWSGGGNDLLDSKDQGVYKCWSGFNIVDCTSTIDS